MHHTHAVPASGLHNSTTVRAVLLAVAHLAAAGMTGCGTREPDVATFVVRLEEAVCHIVSPVDEHGYVDYLEAANLRHSVGVTEDENWEVAIRRVFGPLDWDDVSQRDYCRRLGIEASGGARETLGFGTPGNDAAGDLVLPEECRRQFWRIEGPWSADDHRELHQWLQSRSRHLDYLVESSHLPRKYTPYVMSADAHEQKILAIRQFWRDVQESDKVGERVAGRLMSGLIGDLTAETAPLSRFHANESMNQSRESARLLRTRALLRIAEDDISGARSDLLAIHRIGRLVSEGMVGEWIVGTAIDGMAGMYDAALLESGKLTKDDCREHLRDLSDLGPFRAIADVMDVDSRHESLDAMQWAARRWPATSQAIEAMPRKPSRKIRLAIRNVDWNASMQRLNVLYDSFVAALREADPVKRAAAVEALRPQQVTSNPEDFANALVRAAEVGPDGVAEFLAEQYFGRFAFATACNLELEHQARRIVVCAAYAAYLFQFENGSPPTSVEVLAPWLKGNPIDPFTGLPLKITSIDGATIIYSVGVNRIDDGGIPREEDSDKDDIRVRVTAR